MTIVNGTGFLIWTTREGGLFKVRKCTDEEYEQIKKDRRVPVFTYRDEERPEEYEEPFYIVFARAEDNFDWGFGSSREEHAGRRVRC